MGHMFLSSVERWEIGVLWATNHFAAQTTVAVTMLFRVFSATRRSDADAGVSRQSTEVGLWSVRSAVMAR